MTRHTNDSRVRAIPAAAAGAVAAVLALSACGDDDDVEGAHLPTLEVVAGEAATGAAAYSFDMPDEVHAGPTRISLANDGDEPHHAQLFRLADGATVADLRGALTSGGPPAALVHGRFEGGTGLVAPGGSSRADAIVDLAAGTYAFICFVEDAGGAPHLAHGMVEPFEVTGEAAGSSPPPADARGELIDYGFDLPDTLPGDATLAITNAAEAEPHEMIVGRLEGEATADDVAQALDRGEPPPMTPVGGLQAIFPGTTQLLQLDLEPGEYVVVCQVPSPADGQSHHAKGMIRRLTVT
jgi:hypothetical protein